MKLLLDTHALIWWWNGDERLSLNAREAIIDDSNTVMVSAASVWEMSTKHRLGRLPEADVALRAMEELMSADHFAHLAVQWRHCLLAGQYPQAHGDPFDRILAAQATVEQARLVTRDEAFEAFSLNTLW